MHMLNTGLLPELPTESTEANKLLESTADQAGGNEASMGSTTEIADSAVAISPSSSPPSRPSKRYRLGS